LENESSINGVTYLGNSILLDESVSKILVPICKRRRDFAIEIVQVYGDIYDFLLFFLSWDWWKIIRLWLRLV
jgi:hypothetical protein